MIEQQGQVAPETIGDRLPQHQQGNDTGAGIRSRNNCAIASPSSNSIGRAIAVKITVSAGLHMRASSNSCA